MNNSWLFGCKFIVFEVSSLERVRSEGSRVLLIVLKLYGRKGVVC